MSSRLNSGLWRGNASSSSIAALARTPALATCQGEMKESINPTEKERRQGEGEMESESYYPIQAQYL